jgi:putative ABC transport system permease protein
MGMYLSLAWRNIWRNKKRSTITIASVFFAVVIALFTRSMQLGSYRHMIRNAVSFYTGYIQLHSAGYWDKQSIDHTFVYSDSLANLLSDVAHVTASTPRLESFALLSSGDQTAGAAVVGIAPQTEDRITKLAGRIVEGAYIGPEDERIILARGLAGHLDAVPGDTVVLLGQGYHGVMAAGKYEVAGLAAFPSPDLDASISFLSLPAAQSLYGAPLRASAVVFMIDSQSSLSAALSGIRKRVDAFYEVMSWDEMLPELVEYIEVDNASGLISLWIIYMVIGFGILGTILMMTMERTREFGMLIAIGMKRSRLAMIIFLESVMLSLIAVLIGSALGLPLLLYMRGNPITFGGRTAEVFASYGFEPIMPFSADPVIFLTQGLSILAMAILAAVYPVVRAFKLAPVEAFRSA